MADRTPLAGRYRLEDRLGSGGMGDVWRARDEFLGRTVAVKEVRLPAGLDAARRADFSARLLREARAAAALPHPSIITVHDVLWQDERPWIVMDLIDGPSLENVRIERGPLPPRRVAALGLDLLDALCLAHERGILHRDVKPANVLLNGDRAVLTDFGIATVAGDARATAAEGVVGSPGYMAPERLRDAGGAGPSSDLWSLGATLYAAVEGRRPFERPTALAMIGAVLTEDAAPPRLAGQLGPVLMAMLDRDPQRRPVPAEIRRALQAVAGVVPAPVRPVPLPPPAGAGLPATVPGAAPGAPGLSRPLLVVAGAAALALVAVTGYLLVRPSDSPPATGAAPSTASPAALTAAPDPCTLLTPEQAGPLTGVRAGTAQDSATCAWADLELTVRFLPAQDGKSPEDVGKDTFALLRRQAEGSSGTGSDPAATVVTTRPRDVPGLGDEAFAQDETTSGILSAAESTVWVRSGRLILQLSRRGAGDAATVIHDTTLQAARHALRNLTP